MPSPRLAPSETAGATGTVEVAGRVISVSGRDGEPGRGSPNPSGPAVTLADAFAVVEARLAAGHDLAPGDLVVLEGALSGGVLSGARVVEQARPARGTAAGEGERLRGGVGRGLRARANALRAVRAFFDERAFLEV